MRTGELEISIGTVKLAAPNMYAIFAKAGGGGAPNPALASIYQLLEGSEALQSMDLLQKYSALNAHYRGLYEIAALCLVEPKMRLEGTPGEGEIGPDDLCWNDLFAIYYRFFCSYTPARKPVANLPGTPSHDESAGLGGAAASVSRGDDVSPAPLHDPGD